MGSKKLNNLGYLSIPKEVAQLFTNERDEFDMAAYVRCMLDKPVRAAERQANVRPPLRLVEAR